MRSCITSEKCINKWTHANNLIYNTITDPLYQFDTLKDAVKFKNLNKRTRENLVTIYLNKLIITNIEEYRALDNFNKIYAEDVNINPIHINMIFPTFFEKVQNIHKLYICFTQNFGLIDSLPQSLTHLVICNKEHDQLNLLNNKLSFTAGTILNDTIYDKKIILTNPHVKI